MHKRVEDINVMVRTYVDSDYTADLDKRISFIVYVFIVFNCSVC